MHDHQYESMAIPAPVTAKSGKWSQDFGIPHFRQTHINNTVWLVICEFSTSKLILNLSIMRINVWNVASEVRRASGLTLNKHILDWSFTASCRTWWTGFPTVSRTLPFLELFLLGKNSWIHHNFQVFAHLKSLGRWSIYAPKYSKYFWTWVNILTRIMWFAVYSFTIPIWFLVNGASLSLY